MGREGVLEEQLKRNRGLEFGEDGTGDAASKAAFPEDSTMIFVAI